MAQPPQRAQHGLAGAQHAQHAPLAARQLRVVRLKLADGLQLLRSFLAPLRRRGCARILASADVDALHVRRQALQPRILEAGVRLVRRVVALRVEAPILKTPGYVWEGIRGARLQALDLRIM